MVSLSFYIYQKDLDGARPWTSEMLDDYWADDLLSVWWTRWDFSDGSASLEDLCCLVRECWDWELHWRLALAIGPSSFILPSASSPSQLPPSLPHIRTETRTLTSRSLLAARRACSTDLPRECWFLIFFCQQIFIRPSLLKVLNLQPMSNLAVQSRCVQTIDTDEFSLATQTRLL